MSDAEKAADAHVIQEYGRILGSLEADRIRKDFLAGYAAAMQWRPIESAPKTFMPPISTNNHHAPPILGLWGKSFYCVASWGGESQPFWIDGNNNKIPFQPTRWLPLPPSE